MHVAPSAPARISSLVSRWRRLNASRWSTATTLRLCSVALGLAAWEVAGQIGDTIAVPPLSSVIAAWFTLLNDGSLIRELLVSLQALSVGFLLAVLVGLGLGLAIGTLPDLDHLLEPYVSALLALPSVAYIPLIMLWLGFGLEARIAIVFEFAVLVIAINTRAGVLAVDRSLMEMGRSFGMTRQQLFTSIVLRAASPTIFAGLRIGIGRAVKGMVTAELLLVLVGLGGMIRYLGSSFRVDFLLAVVVTIVVVAMFMTAVLQSIDRRLNAWAVAVRP